MVTNAHNCIRWVLAALALIVTHVSAVAPGKSESAANAGTLNCMLAAGDAVGASRELSCTFVRTAGPNAQFTGVVKRSGARAPGNAKIVLIWSVLAPKVDVDSADLSGRYEGVLGSRAAGEAKTVGLVGGANRSIRLVPLGIGPAAGTNAAYLILDLELTTMKA